MNFYRFAESEWSSKVMEKTRMLIEFLTEKSSRFSEDIEGINAVVVREGARKDDPAGYYLPSTRTFYIYADKIADLQFLCHVVLHEIGHHVVEKIRGISKDYSAKKKNESYCKEEIRAENYAFGMIKRFLMPSSKKSPDERRELTYAVSDILDRTYAYDAFEDTVYFIKRNLEWLKDRLRSLRHGIKKVFSYTYCISSYDSYKSYYNTVSMKTSTVSDGYTVWSSTSTNSTVSWRYSIAC